MKKFLNIYESISNKSKYILVTIGLILLMLTWGIIPQLILLLLNINISTIPEYIKIFITLIFDIAFLFLIIFFYKKDVKEDFLKFFNKKNIIKNFKTSLRYWLVGVLIMVTCNLIISTITNSIATNEEAVREMIDKFPLYMAFQVMIYAPISEEIIFRKSISDITKNKYLYIFISGFIFGFLHVISSITTMVDLLYLLPYCSLGFIFALLYKKTNNIFSTITAHSIHNTLAFILYLIGGTI